MQQMSLKLRKVLPNVDVLGELRDQPGVLARVAVDDACDATAIDDIEQALVRAGATGWHWAPEERGNTVKIRVYFGRAWPWGRLALLAIVSAAALLHYDIHYHLAKALGR